MIMIIIIVIIIIIIIIIIIMIIIIKGRSAKNLELQKCICHPYCNQSSWDCE